MLIRCVLVVVISGALSLLVNLLTSIVFGPVVGLIEAIPGGLLIGYVMAVLSIKVGYVKL